jgi:hypothetical protein
LRITRHTHTTTRATLNKKLYRYNPSIFLIPPSCAAFSFKCPYLVKLKITIF